MEDPMNWDCDQVLACLHQRNIERETIEKFRFHEVNGRGMLTFLNNEVLRDDMDIRQLGRRLAVMYIVDELRRNSDAYENRVLMQAMNTPLPESDIKAMDLDAPLTPPLLASTPLRPSERQPPRGRPLHIQSPFLDGGQYSEVKIHDLDRPCSSEEGPVALEAPGPAPVTPKKVPRRIIPANVSPLQTRDSSEPPIDTVQSTNPAQEPVHDSDDGRQPKPSRRIVPESVTSLEARLLELESSPSPPVEVPIVTPKSPVVTKRGERHRYFPNKARPIESLFYDVEEGSEIQSEYGSSDDFISYNPRPKAPGERRYICRQMRRMHRIIDDVQDVGVRTRNTKNRLRRCVNFYENPDKILPRHQTQSVTVFDVESTVRDIVARPTDNIKLHRISTTKLGFPWPTTEAQWREIRDSHTQVFVHTSEKLQPQLDIPQLRNNINTDYDYLTKWENTEGADYIYPVYGESGSENEYDQATWNEMEAEHQGPLQKVEGKSYRNRLTKEQLEEALEEGIEIVIRNWQRKQLPKLEARVAYKRWTRARKCVKATISKAEAKIQSLTERLQKQRNEMLVGKIEWSNKDQVHKICRGNMSLTITNREEEKWTVELLNRKEAPQPYITQKKAARVSEEEAMDDGDDEDSESEFQSSDDDDLAGFIISDADEPSPELLSEIQDEEDEEEEEDNADDSAQDEDIMSLDSEHASGHETLDTTKTSEEAMPPVKQERPTPPQSQKNGPPILIDLTQTSPKSSPPGSSLKTPRTDKRHKAKIDMQNISAGAKIISISSGEDSNHEDSEPDRRSLLSRMVNRLDPGVQSGIYINLQELEKEPLFSDLFTVVMHIIKKTPTNQRSTKKLKLNSDLEVICDHMSKCYNRWVLGHRIFKKRLSPEEEKKLDDIDQFKVFTKLVMEILGPSMDCVELEDADNLETRRKKRLRLEDIGKGKGKGKDRNRNKHKPGTSRNRHIGKGSPIDFESSEEDVRGPDQRKRKRKVVVEDISALQKRQNQSKFEEARQRRIRYAEERAIMRGETLPAGQIIVNVGHYDEDSIIVVPEALSDLLMPHQIEGIRFLWAQLVQTGTNQGALLAHTMGLGKTLQVIAFLYTLAQAGASEDPKVHGQIPQHLRNSRTIVLCPPGLVENWVDEFVKWVPAEPLVENEPVWKYLGRVIYWDSQMSIKNKLNRLTQWSNEGGVLVIGYQLFRNMTTGKSVEGITEENLARARKMLHEEPNIIIADEAHTFKNSRSQLFNTVKQFKSVSRVAMTGSPLSNSLEEYWTMIEWIEPGFLGPSAHFKQKYMIPINNGLWADSTKSQRKASQQMLYVLKKDIKFKMHRADISVIESRMKQKTEFLIKIPLSNMQKSFYTKFVEDPGSATNLFAGVFLMGLICHHPLLFIKSIEKVEREKREKLLKAKSKITQDPSAEVIEDDDEPLISPGIQQPLVSQPLDLTIIEGHYTWARPLLESFTNYKDISYSYKLLALRKIIEHSLAQEDQVLVFSHHIDTLDDLEMRFPEWGIPYMRLDGSTPTNKRQQLTKQFNTGIVTSKKGQKDAKAKAGSRANVFMISTKAGGLGLNLPSANRVVIFDFDWCPMWEQQAIGRAYRLGQKKPVFVYRFQCGGTFEDRIWSTTQFKTQLSSRVVDTKEPIRKAKKDNKWKYLVPPQEIERENVRDYRGLDKVLDALIDETDYVYAIAYTETFQPDIDDALTAEEVLEAEKVHEETVLERRSWKAGGGGLIGADGLERPSYQLRLEEQQLLFEASRMKMNGPPITPAAPFSLPILRTPVAAGPSSSQPVRRAASNPYVKSTPTSTAFADSPMRPDGIPLTAPRLSAGSASSGSAPPPSSAPSRFHGKLNVRSVSDAAPRPGSVESREAAANAAERRLSMSRNKVDAVGDREKEKGEETVKNNAFNLTFSKPLPNIYRGRSGGGAGSESTTPKHTSPAHLSPRGARGSPVDRFSASSEDLLPSPTPSTNTSLPIEGPRISPTPTRSSMSPDTTSRSGTPGTTLPMQSNAASTWLDDTPHDLERGDSGVRLDTLSSPPSAPPSASDENGGWNSRHPCFPHRNPHVPRDSPEFEHTRVIRLQRDYMLSGDLSPAFSNIYPEILEPYVPEPTFRDVVRTVNERLRTAHDPWSVRNWLDGVLGLLTCWVLEDVVATGAKRAVAGVEAYLRDANRQLAQDGREGRFVPLRRTGYLCLDVVIPDPVVSLEDSESGSESGDEEGGARRDGPPRLPEVMVNGRAAHG
ncbi:hypothetical protein EDC01DRAFT_788515 [Geopyxis carbonaria]|nr:hypothetical protein EDC01DRAFT_788515 [Geopyxis carbonaria]